MTSSAGLLMTSASSSTTSLGGEDPENIRILLAASVFSEFGDSCVYSRFGTTALGQHYVLVSRKRFLGGYSTLMITANMRNRPFISAPFKISGTQVLAESRDFIDRLVMELSRPGMFSLRDQPLGCTIPLGKEWIQLDLVPVEVHANQDLFLEKGDELFCEVILSGVKFYHSGIYAGDGEVYHFVCDPQESESLAEALAVFSGVPGRVLLDSWMEYVYALVEVTDVPPRIFRASHPLVCRSGDQVIKEAEHLQTVLEEYDIRRSNCQHFTSTCSTGVPFSYDMTSNLKYLACTILKPSATIVGTMTRFNKDRSSFNSSSS
ncbi:unnamed protein product [Caenorhabditis auriculariae]|uniref:LRAT domain-containing protein n=1 Tax=Caenorhabditis auriculariae TaxID=2777116 RepID=A0A8S1HSR0_9PELO|nr:unnamed protein product [Caenorhabditis auriculariae]